MGCSIILNRVLSGRIHICQTLMGGRGMVIKKKKKKKTFSILELVVLGAGGVVDKARPGAKVLG